MKSNNLDDILKKKKNSNTSFYFKIAIIIFAMFILFFIPFAISNMISSDSKSYEIKTNGEQYGTSNFFKYQGKIYVFTLNDGMQALENVDMETFKTLNSGDYYTKNIGLDKNNVYFGNIIIPDLDSNKLEVIGNGYYTDGTNSYFFSPFSELDKNSSKYIYPYKKIENAKNLKAYENLELFAVDGDNVYYKGEILKNTDLNTLKIIDKNNEYFADKENVYYRSKLLPIKNSGKLKIVSSEQGDTFLYDEASGYVFIGDYTFDKEKAPYKVIGNNGTNLYNLIFIGKDGIYYYCNIATPYILEENTVKFIDYDLDLRVYADGSFKVLDRGEYKYHQKLMNYPEKLDKILKDELTNLIELSKSKKDGFNNEEIKKQFAAYERLKKKN